MRLKFFTLHIKSTKKGTKYTVAGYGTRIGTLAIWFYLIRIVLIIPARTFKSCNLGKKKPRCCVVSDPAGTRTQDPNIKSVVLYQLSYKIILLIITRF